MKYIRLFRKTCEGKRGGTGSTAPGKEVVNNRTKTGECAYKSFSGNENWTKKENTRVTKQTKQTLKVKGPSKGRTQRELLKKARLCSTEKMRGVPSNNLG